MKPFKTPTTQKERFVPFLCEWNSMGLEFLQKDVLLIWSITAFFLWFFFVCLGVFLCVRVPIDSIMFSPVMAFYFRVLICFAWNPWSFHPQKVILEASFLCSVLSLSASSAISNDSELASALLFSCGSFVYGGLPPSCLILTLWASRSSTPPASLF